MAEQNNGMFNSADLAVFKKTNDLRLKLIDSMTEDDVPTRSGDIRVLNETLDAADRQVMELAKIKVKQQENEGNARTLNMVAEILGRVSASGDIKPISNKEIELPDDYIPVDIVPGETDTSPEELDLSTFIKEDDEQ